MATVKNAIPVYDISTLVDNKQIAREMMAERFAPYLKVHPNLTAPHRHSFYHIVLFTKGKELHATALCNLDMVRLHLLELFISVQRNISNNKSAAVPQQNQLILYNFRKLVNSNFAEKHLPKDYASLLYITPNHLNALCKDLLGKPAGEVIRDRVLLEAKRLLVNDGLSIAQIAAQLNFADNSHFTKFFKKYTGITPELFRLGSVMVK